VSTTPEQLLSDAQLLLAERLARGADGAAQHDAAGALSRIGRYLAHVIGEGGLGDSPAQPRAGERSALQAERIRLTEIAADRCAAATARDPAGGGRASDLVGAALDALRIREPPPTPEQQWAIVSRIGEVASTAAHAASLIDSSPTWPRLDTAVRQLERQTRLDPPDPGAGDRLDAPIIDSAAAPGRGIDDAADQLAALQQQLRTRIARGAVTLDEVKQAAAAGINVAGNIGTYASRLGLDAAAADAAAALHDWTALRRGMNDLDDFRRAHSDPQLVTRANRLVLAIRESVHDPDLLARADLPAAARALRAAAETLPDLAHTIGDYAAAAARDGRIRVRDNPELRDLHSRLFAGTRYPDLQWTNTTSSARLAAIGETAAEARRSSAALAVAMDRHAGPTQRPHLRTANRQLAAGAAEQPGPAAPQARIDPARPRPRPEPHRLDAAIDRGRDSGAAGLRRASEEAAQHEAGRRGRSQR
jgi:hypothetical protein